MSDARPQPQYGEYATPEQQRAAIRHPAPGVPADVPRDHPKPPTAPATTVAAQPTRTADRVITIILLIYGLITVVSAVPQLVDFTAFARTWMQVAGVDGEFTNSAAGRTWGIIGASVYAGGWLITAALSWLSISRRRVSWWIPLVGAIVTFVVVSFCLVIPLMGDPAVARHFASFG